MPPIDDEKKKFDERLQKVKQTRQARLQKDHAAINGQNSLPAEPNLEAIPDLEGRMAALDGWLEQRITIFRNEMPQVSPVSTEGEVQTHPPADAPAQAWFSEIDETMLDSFDLRRFPIPAGLSRNTQSFSDTHRYVDAVLPGLGLSQAEMEAIRQNPPEKLLRSGAVYLPGEGCLVNEKGFDIPKGQKSEDKPDIRVAILKAITFAKWGHGLIAEYTQFGLDSVKDGLWQAWQAQQLGIPLPKWEAKRPVLDAMVRSFSIAGRGWCEWLWEYLACKSFTPVGEGLVIKRPSMRRSWEVFKRAISIFPPFVDIDGAAVRLLSVADLLGYLFLEKSKLAPSVLNQVLNQVEPILVNSKVTPGSTQDRFLGYLGWQYFSGLEGKLGTYCVPYALLIAFHCPGGADLLEMADFEIYRKKHPRNIVDARLAILSGLDSGVKYDPHGLSIEAWERFKLDSPHEYMK